MFSTPDGSRWIDRCSGRDRRPELNPVNPFVFFASVAVTLSGWGTQAAAVKIWEKCSALCNRFSAQSTKAQVLQTALLALFLVLSRGVRRYLLAYYEWKHGITCPSGWHWSKVSSDIVNVADPLQAKWIEAACLCNFDEGWYFSLDKAKHYGLASDMIQGPAPAQSHRRNRSKMLQDQDSTVVIEAIPQDEILPNGVTVMHYRIASGATASSDELSEIICDHVATAVPASLATAKSVTQVSQDDVLPTICCDDEDASHHATASSTMDAFGITPAMYATRNDIQYTGTLPARSISSDEPTGSDE